MDHEGTGATGTEPPAGLTGSEVTQARLVLGAITDVLGADVLGVYLHGSAVQGGLRPRSDLDLLAVIGRPTSEDEKRDLIGRLLPMWQGPNGRTRPIELTMIVQGDVRPWRYPPPLDLHYGEWWRDPFQRGELPWRSPDPDLAIVLTAVRRSSQPLLGPPPAVLLDPVPADDLRRSLLDSIPDLMADLEGDEANVVLTLARMWLTMATGTIESKDVAADWALTRLPPEHRPVLHRAKGVYLGEAADDWSGLGAQVGAHVDHVRAEVVRQGQVPLPFDGLGT